MPVALHDLRGGGLDPQREHAAGRFLDGRGDGGVGSDGPTDRADGDRCPRRLKAYLMAPHLVDPDRHLQAEGGRLGVDSVRAARAEASRGWPLASCSSACVRRATPAARRSLASRSWRAVAVVPDIAGREAVMDIT